jgi:hypothetical protein
MDVVGIKGDRPFCRKGDRPFLTTNKDGWRKSDRTKYVGAILPPFPQPGRARGHRPYNLAKYTCRGNPPAVSIGRGGHGGTDTSDRSRL